MNSFLIVFAIILYFLNKDKSVDVANKNYVLLMTILLIVVSGLRHEGVGNDTYAYKMMFDQTGLERWPNLLNNFWTNYIHPTDNGVKDPGYKLFSKFIYVFVPEYRFFLFVVASILLVPLGLFVYRNSRRLETTMFFYVFYITLFYHYLPNSAVRQSLTFGIVLIGYLFLIKRRILIFIAHVILGSLIHQSCLLVLILIPAVYISNSVHIYIYKFCILLFLLFLISPDWLAVFFMDRNEIYDTFLSGGYYVGTQGKPVMVLLLFLGLYILGWMGINKQVRSNDPHFRLFCVGSALVMVFLPLIWVSPALLRIISYFGPFMGIIVGDALCVLSRGRLLRICIVAIFLLHSLTSNHYKFMWEEMQLHERYYSYVISNPEKEKSNKQIILS